MRIWLSTIQERLQTDLEEMLPAVEAKVPTIESWHQSFMGQGDLGLISDVFKFPDYFDPKPLDIYITAYSRPADLTPNVCDSHFRDLDGNKLKTYVPARMQYGTRGSDNNARDQRVVHSNFCIRSVVRLRPQSYKSSCSIVQ